MQKAPHRISVDYSPQNSPEEERDFFPVEENALHQHNRFWVTSCWQVRSLFLASESISTPGNNMEIPRRNHTENPKPS